MTLGAMHRYRRDDKPGVPLSYYQLLEVISNWRRGGTVSAFSEPYQVGPAPVAPGGASAVAEELTGFGPITVRSCFQQSCRILSR